MLLTVICIRFQEKFSFLVIFITFCASSSSNVLAKTYGILKELKTKLDEAYSKV